MMALTLNYHAFRRGFNALPAAGSWGVPKQGSRNVLAQRAFWEEETQGSGRIFLRFWQKWSLTYFAVTRFVFGQAENERMKKL